MAGGGPAQFPEVYAARLKLNHDVMVYYAIFLASMMLVFITLHFLRTLTQQTHISSIPIVTPVSRILRKHLIRKVPGLPSTGHAWVGLLYVTVNIVFCFTMLLDHPIMSFQSNVASRTGWLATANMILAVFFGLKNTPLGYLTAWSYERLNFLHQIVGYTTMAETIIHAASYAHYFLQRGPVGAERMRVPDEIYGIVSGFTMLVLVVVGFTIRRGYYEMFYIIHVSFFLMTMVFVGLHQPELGKGFLYALFLGTGLWVLDRLVRIARVVYYSFNNRATVYPLPHGGTRIVMQKPPVGAQSGEHCFLWIPSIRSIEMHPFTIAASEPLEFVAASYDGFTSDLHEYAKRNPGATLRASVEGSYGTFPDASTFDTVVLVAGGSGASFTIGQALHMLKNLKSGSQQKVIFAWMVKDNAHLEWFSNHLATIRHTLNSDIQLYVTRPVRPSIATVDSDLEPASPVAQPPIARTDTFSSSGSSTSVLRDAEKEKVPLEKSQSTPAMPTRILTRQLSDPEKSGGESNLASPLSPLSPMSEYMASPADSIAKLPIMDKERGREPRLRNANGKEGGVATHIHGIPITYARPDVPAIVRRSVESTASDKRVLVMGCGPDGLMKQVRNTAAECITAKGPAVELHCEEFGW